MAAGPEGTNPVDFTTSTFIGYITSLGLAGIGLLVMFWLYIFPGKLTKQARDDARADLLEENARLREQNARLAEQRDDALTVLRDQVAPILIQFNSTMATLLPVMQDVVRNQERRGGGR
jgi:hypothetical protein